MNQMRLLFVLIPFLVFCLFVGIRDGYCYEMNPIPAKYTEETKDIMQKYSEENKVMTYALVEVNNTEDLKPFVARGGDKIIENLEENDVDYKICNVYTTDISGKHVMKSQVPVVWIPDWEEYTDILLIPRSSKQANPKKVDPELHEGFLPNGLSADVEVLPVFGYLQNFYEKYPGLEGKIREELSEKALHAVPVGIDDDGNLTTGISFKAMPLVPPPQSSILDQINTATQTIQHGLGGAPANAGENSCSLSSSSAAHPYPHRPILQRTSHVLPVPHPALQRSSHKPPAKRMKLNKPSHQFPDIQAEEHDEKHDTEHGQNNARNNAGNNAKSGKDESDI